MTEHCNALIGSRYDSTAFSASELLTAAALLTTAEKDSTETWQNKYSDHKKCVFKTRF